MKRAIIVPGLVTAFVALSPVGVALADNPHDHGNIGQPDQSLEAQPSHPPGFDTRGFANAEGHYANKEGTHAVSQYDVAAFQFSNRGP
jgi:hypothetical protein